MAEFNPDVQKTTATDIPAVHFPFMSREISPLTPDRSKEFLYKGIGQAAEQGTKLADNIYDQVVLQDVRQSVDPLQASYTQQLRDTLDDIHGTPKADGVMGAQNKGEQLPDDLKGLPQRLSRSLDSKAGGKRTESQHYLDILDETTRLRNKYIGKRDLIDQEVSKITGVHPANQALRSMINDYNSFVENQKGEANKMETRAYEALKNGEIDYPLYAKWKSGDGSVTDGDILKAIAQHGAIKNKFELDRMGHESKTYNREDKAADATQSAANYAYGKMDAAMDSVIKGAGLGTDKLTEYMAGVAAGRYEKPTGAQAEEFGAKINLVKESYLSGLRRYFNTLRPGQKETDAVAMGPDKMEDLLTKVGKEFDGWREAMSKGNFDVAELGRRQVTATVGDAAAMSIKDPKYGAHFANVMAMKELLGPAFPQWYQNNIKSFDFLTDKQQQAEILRDYGDLVSKPSLFKTQVEQAQAKGISGAKAGKFFDEMTRYVPSMLGKEVPNEVKERVVNNVFGVDNFGTVDLFTGNTVNAKGMSTNDQLTVFNRLGSTQVADHVWKLAKDTNKPELYANMQMWEEHEFQTLFRNQMTDIASYPTDFTVDIGYDPKAHKFMVKGKTGQGGFPSENLTSKVPPQLQRVVNTVNSALANLSHVQEKTNTNTDIFLYKYLTSQPGFGQPDQIGRQPGTSLADRLVQAIQDAHQTQRPQ